MLHSFLNKLGFDRNNSQADQNDQQIDQKELGILLFEAIQAKDETAVRNIIKLAMRPCLEDIQSRDPTASRFFNILELASGSAVIMKLLLREYGTQISPESKGLATIIEASGGYDETVKLLLDKCTQDISSYYKSRAITYAASFNHLKIVDNLLRRCGHEIEGTAKVSALNSAIARNKFQTVALLLNNYPQQIINHAGNLLLPSINVIDKGDFETVELVFDCFGPEMSAADKSLAVKAAIKKNDNKIIALLVNRYSQEISAIDRVLALNHFVCSDHDQDIIKQLLNCLNKSEALLIASQKGYEKVVELLLTRFNQEINIEDKNLALAQAIENHHFALVNCLLKNNEVKDELAKVPQQINDLIKSFTLFNKIKLTDIGLTLKKAIELGYDQLVELLLSNFDKNELLLNASQYSITSNIVELLVKDYGHKINDDTKNLVFQNACEEGHPIAKFLLRHCSSAISNENKKLAFDRSLSKGKSNSHSYIVQLLLIDSCEEKNLSEKIQLLQDAIKNGYFDVTNYLLEINEVRDEFIKVPQNIHDLLTMFSLKSTFYPPQSDYLEKLLHNGKLRFYLIENAEHFPKLKKFKEKAEVNAGRRFKNARCIVPSISSQEDGEQPNDDLSPEFSRKKLKM